MSIKYKYVYFEFYLGKMSKKNNKNMKEKYYTVCTNCNELKISDDVNRYSIPIKHYDCPVHFCHINTFKNNRNHNHFLCKKCYDEIVISYNLKEDVNKLRKSLQL